VRAFLDTSVLVSTFYGDHQHHEASKDLFLRFDKTEACCGAHSLAEVYSALTGMPGKARVSGDEALLFLGNVRERLTLVALTDEEYFRAVEASSAIGIAGGGIYDAILGHCALKADAESIYTWNLKDFTRLGPEIAGRVKTP
jgi:predicted nucleic acid-binding protein